MRYIMGIIFLSLKLFGGPHLLFLKNKKNMPFNVPLKGHHRIEKRHT